LLKNFSEQNSEQLTLFSVPQAHIFIFRQGQ
jgi:hypothetical protein